jgi:hypothetical protein
MLFDILQPEGKGMISVVAVVVAATFGVPAVELADPGSDRPLAERFANPPAASRILKIVHTLPDDPAEQDQLLESLTMQGFGGMATNVSFDGAPTRYVENDRKWESLVRAVREAKKAGMALWLYDERGYPSGNADGITMRDHPEWEAQGLYATETTTDGGEVSLDAPPGKVISASAFPVKDDEIAIDDAVDVRDHVRDGKLSWQAPAGHWRVMIFTIDRLYEGTHAAMSLADKRPYINLLMPEPTARFIEVTHGAYAKHLGDDLGKYFVSTFTDEPSLMSMFMKPQTWRVIPWSPNLPVEFEKRRGYLLGPLVAELFCDAGAQGMKARYDFWQTVGDLVSENYFGQIRKWCDAHNVLSGGHLLLEEPLLTHVPLYGNFFQCARQLSAPSIDCLTSIPREVPWYVARLLSSVAELEGRTVTMSETSDHCQRYRPAGDTRPVQTVSEEEIRGTCNRLIVNGITTQTSYYSFAELSTLQLARLNTYIGRCSTTLAGGHQVCDVALLYPAESLWPHFTPAHNWVADSPAMGHRIEKVYRDAAESLFQSQRDFTYVDARALTEARVEGGVLRHGELERRVVVLPCADTLPMKAWENLLAFWKSGGMVIALSALPANSESEFPCERVKGIAGEMFGLAPGKVASNDNGGASVFLPAGQEFLLPSMLDALVAKDVACDRGAPLRVTHRRIDDHDVYFIINDSPDKWAGPIRFAAESGERWDPMTGHVEENITPETILQLEPYAGMLFRFAKSHAPERSDKKGVLPELARSPLPGYKPPTFNAGQYVQQTALRQNEAKTMWQAVGTLSKGNTDTFLFMSFDYDPPVDLHAAAFLAASVDVPAKQAAATQLIMLLRDKNGVEYYCNTGRFLNEPGLIDFYCPLNGFERAGWVKGPDKSIDLTAIATMRIGWGGYYGKEGESVMFSTSAPATGSLGKFKI